MLFGFLATAVFGCSAPHDADAYGVSGLDVSHYQGVIEWPEVAAAQPAFIFIKATEGRSLRDHAFLHNWTKAGEAGIRRGAYHFFRPEVDPAEQASLFFGTVLLQPGDFPPVLDVEDAGNLPPTLLVSAVREWLDLAELRYGVKPILYTGQNFYNRYLAGKFNDYPLWLARYDRQQPVTICGRDYQFWQYSDRGRVRGIKGKVDRNVFTGSYAELQALLIPGADTTPPHPEYVDDEPAIPPAPIGPKDDLAGFGVE